MDKLIERFIGYAKKETRSDAGSNTVPSSPNQTIFLQELAKELENLGFEEVKLNPSHYSCYNR